MVLDRARRGPIPAALLLAVALAARAQQGPWPPEGPPYPPPPRPRPEDRGAPETRKPEKKEEKKEPEAPWTLDDDLREKLAKAADLYRAYALRFTCLETVRAARYDAQGEASDESVRRYAYLLERESDGATLREYRQRVREDGRPRGGEVKDEEPFPPAYSWVLLFSRFNQSFFAYRDLGERFEGFDWIREIEFRGALPFTDGKDIRQWEGTALVDATTFTPVEIHAKPSGQDARLRALYDRWSQAFSILGFHAAPRPLLYSSDVQFGLRKDGLSFPTELRYDTLIATSPRQTVPFRASSRHYDGYQFFKTSTTETPGKPVVR